MASEILDTYWISGIETIGIAAVKNEMGKVTFRIAQIRGENIDVDKNYIRDHGAKVYPDGLIDFFTKHEKK